MTVFSICFNGSSFLEPHYQVKEDPYDYAILTGEQQRALDESMIHFKANENNISTMDWHSLDMLLLAENISINIWIKMSGERNLSYRSLTMKLFSVFENRFEYFEDSDGTTFQTFSNEQGNF